MTDDSIGTSVCDKVCTCNSSDTDSCEGIHHRCQCYPHVFMTRVMTGCLPVELRQKVPECRTSKYGRYCHECICCLNIWSTEEFRATCNAVSHKCLCTLDMSKCLCNHSSKCICHKKYVSSGEPVKCHTICKSTNHTCICIKFDEYPGACMATTHNCICHRKKEICKALTHTCLCLRKCIRLRPELKCNAEKHKYRSKLARLRRLEKYFDELRYEFFQS